MTGYRMVRDARIKVGQNASTLPQDEPYTAVLLNHSQITTLLTTAVTKDLGTAYTYHTFPPFRNLQYYISVFALIF